VDLRGLVGLYGRATDPQDLAAARRVNGLGAYLAYRTAAAVIGVLPEAGVRWLGVNGGKAWWYLAKGKRELVRKNLARVVGAGAATDDRVRAMFSSYGRYWAEVFWVRERRQKQILEHSKVHNPERITDAIARGKGVIVALPHMGNWEMAGPAAASLGAPMLAAAEALPNQRIVDWFLKTRAALGIEVVIVGNDRASTARLLSRLKEGGAIALLSDRDLSGRGIDVEFFGERTTLPAGPVALADKTGATLLPVGCYFRNGRGHDFIVAAPVDIPDLPNKAERIAIGTQNYAHALEELIGRDPEQWHLFQPNWPSDKVAG
jgi:KDO2-lipid IV(A) lauroyltransferase